MKTAIIYLKSLLLLLFTLTQLQVQAGDITSIRDGKWSKKSTWDCNCVPKRNDNVTIAAGTQVIINKKAKAFDLTIEPTGTLTFRPNKKLRIRGDFTNNGTFACQNSRVIFKGNLHQFINGSSMTEFYKLKVNNIAGITIHAPVRTLHKLILKKGTVSTCHNYWLTLGPNARAYGASDQSFINGPIEIETDTIKGIVFNTGKNGKHKKTTAIVQSSGSSSIMAEYFDELLIDSCSGGLSHINTPEYWIITPVKGNPMAEVTIHWDEYTNNGNHSINASAVAKQQSNSWVFAGNNDPTGDSQEGSISSNPQLSFGAYTLACTLPDSICSDSTHTHGAPSFKMAGPSNTTINTTSNEDAMDPVEELASENFFSVYPNPAPANQLNINSVAEVSEELLIVVVDMLGKEHYSKVHMKHQGASNIAIDFNPVLAPGMYLITAASDDFHYKQKILIESNKKQ